MTKKLLLTFALLLTAVTGAFADDSGSCGEVSYSYVESTHTLTISGTGAMADYASSSERPWDSYVEDIETIIIENGVTSIGNRAFEECTGLTTVTIPAGVTRIGDQAFRGCIGLTTVTIGSGVTYIGRDSFYGCTNVEVVYCNANPEELTWDESGCDDFKPDGTTIINVADAAPWIEKFTGVVHGTFSDTPYVPLTWNYDAGTKTLTFSGTVIPSYNDPDERPWKDYVEVVENIVIEDGVTRIGDKAFRGCIGLTTVTIGSGVTYIGRDAFYFCTKVEVVYCNADPAKLTWDESGCDDFKPDGTTIINVADAAPWIEKFTGKVHGTFSDTPYVPLTWNYDAGTKTLTFSGTVIPSYNPDERPWKDYVSEVEKIVISDDVTSIGDQAFRGCIGLTTVTIGSGVTYIGSDAFYLCTKVEVVYCNANPAKLTWDENGCDDFKPDGTTIINVADAAPWIEKFTGVVHGTFSDTPYVPLTWNYDAGTKTLTFSGTVIPSYNPDERPWKDYVSEVEKIVISDGVTRIGDKAFRGCIGLTTVTIGSGVTYIGSDAFHDCTKVEVVYCNANPATLTWDENGCDDFKSDGSTIIHVADPAPWIAKFTGKVNGIFSDKPYVPFTWNYDSDTKTLTFSGTAAIPSYNDPDDRPWKDYVSEVEKIVISDGVTSIGNKAFHSCKNLTSVTIPSSVTSIGNYAFYDCPSLTSVTIPDGVTSIGDDVFEGCKNLTSVTIPSSVTSIGNFAFYECTSLTSVTIPSSVTSIGYLAFKYCESLTSVIVNAPNCTLEEDAFDECSELEAIYVPSDKVEYYKAAENWSAYADKITAFIGGDCGAEGHETDVTWLLKGTSPNYTLTISGTGAMADYASSKNQPWKDYRSSITSVIIGSGVTSIGENAFNNCTGLASVTVDAPDCTLGNGALEGCSDLEAIYVPSDLVDHYKTAWSVYASIIMEKIISQGYCGAEGHETDVTWVLKGTSPNYILTISGTGAMADYDSDGQPWYRYAEGIETVVIENGVTSIGNYAFLNCYGLTSVTIPSSVTNIGKKAFLSCKNLPTVTIPASVTSIGDGAFLSCSNLATMTVEAGNKVYDSRNSCNAIIEKETNTLIAGCKGSTIPGDVTSIGEEAFYNCDGLTTVTIPASVTSIGEEAFYYCDGLTTLTIGSGVTYIGNDAFCNCTAVTDVYCYADPTMLTWDESGCDDFKNDGSTIIHVADADPWYAKFTGVVNGIFRDPSTIPLTWKYDSETKTLTFSGTEAIPSYTFSSDRPWYDYVEEVENIVIEEGVRGIGNYAFYNCDGLTTVTIPASVMSIGKEAFSYCKSMTSVTIPASVTSIGTEAFYYCYGLTSVTIPASVTSIGDGAFYYCYGLTTVTIGSSVTYIGRDAFYHCTAVKDVYCYADPDALTWEEDGCDDFMYDGSTKCHVTDADPWSAMFTDVNVDFVGDLAPEAVTNPAGEEYWSSYYNSAAHLKADDNTTVYKATLSGTTVTLTEITDKVITAGQAVLLKKTTNDDVVLTPCADASEDDYSGNDLEGVDAETAKESGSDYYVLSYQNSKLSFYKYSGTTLGANKAFFKIPANSSREFLDILGEVTGIDGRYKMEDGRSDVYYDLSGRRVINPTKKGIYIVNGKKVVIK